MPRMSAELSDALLEAGASEAKARKAAEAVAPIAEMCTEVSLVTTLALQLQHRLSILQWVAGIGFSVLLGLALLNLNWTWQVMHRLPLGR